MVVESLGKGITLLFGGRPLRGCARRGEIFLRGLHPRRGASTKEPGNNTVPPKEFPR